MDISTSDVQEMLASVAQVITAIVTIASIIVKFTPSKKDDSVVAKIKNSKIMNVLAINPKDGNK